MKRLLAIIGLIAMVVAVAGCTSPEATGNIIGSGGKTLAPTTYVWEEVASFQGEFDKVTEPFGISSDVWRINWECQSQRNGEISIYVFPVGSHVIHKSFLDLECPGSGQGFVQKGLKESFFVKVRADAVDSWSVLVEE